MTMMRCAALTVFLSLVVSTKADPFVNLLTDLGRFCDTDVGKSDLSACVPAAAGLAGVGFGIAEIWRRCRAMPQNPIAAQVIEDMQAVGWDVNDPPRYEIVSVPEPNGWTRRVLVQLGPDGAPPTAEQIAQG